MFRVLRLGFRAFGLQCGLILGCWASEVLGKDRALSDALVGRSHWFSDSMDVRTPRAWMLSETLRNTDVSSILVCDPHAKAVESTINTDKVGRVA